MTRDEAMLKLLALEPETRDRIIVTTGWPVEETCAVLDGLVERGAVEFTWCPWQPQSTGRYSAKAA
jgi:NaMN:DMB phosphoribosyltransferase